MLHANISTSSEVGRFEQKKFIFVVGPGASSPLWFTTSRCARETDVGQFANSEPEPPVKGTNWGTQGREPQEPSS